MEARDGAAKAGSKAGPDSAPYWQASNDCHGSAVSIEVCLAANCPQAAPMSAPPE